MKRLLLIVVLSVVCTNSTLAGSRSSFAKPVKYITKKIHKKLPKAGAVLVMSFQDAGGKITSLGKYLANELHVSLANKSAVILERRSLETALQERKLADIGLLDESTVIKIGKSFGAQVVVYGTVVESKKFIAVNIKAVNIEKGFTLGGIIYDIKKTRQIKYLLRSFPDYVDPEARAYSGPIERSKLSVDLFYVGVNPLDKEQFAIGGGGLISLIYDVDKHWALEATGGSYSQKIKENLLPAGELRMTVLFGGLRYKAGNNPYLSPYLSGGVAAFFVSKQKSNDNKPVDLCPENSVTCVSDLNDNVGFYVGGGIRGYFDREQSFAISGDVKYVPITSQTGPDTDRPLPTSKKVEIGGVLVSVGATYRY